MIWANSNEKRIKATPKDRAICPYCNQEVIAKCGSIKIWHWAHKSNINCDSWYEHESKWHINWKNEFPKEQQEVIIGKHIADIKTKDFVIELQNSSLSPEKIIEREKYYKKMIWLINGDSLASGLELRRDINNQLFTFRWKPPPKSWWFATKPIYIDMNFDWIFLIKKIYHNIPCGGYGKFITKKEFLEVFNDRTN